MSYGKNFHQLRDDVWGGKVTDLRDLQHAASAGELTQKGYNYLKDQLPSEAKDPILKKNENDANAKAFDIVHAQIAPGVTKQMLDANPKLQTTLRSADQALMNAIEERKSRQIPPSQYYDPENKEWIGNDAKVFKVTHAAAVAAQIRANQSAAKPRTLGEIVSDARSATDPVLKEKLRQEAIGAGLYDPNAPAVPLPGQQ